MARSRPAKRGWALAVCTGLVEGGFLSLGQAQALQHVAALGREVCGPGRLHLERRAIPQEAEHACSFLQAQHAVCCRRAAVELSCRAWDPERELQSLSTSSPQDGVVTGMTSTGLISLGRQNSSKRPPMQQPSVLSTTVCRIWASRGWQHV